MADSVYVQFRKDGGVEITKTPPSSRVDSMDLSKPREVVDRFNSLPQYLDYPAPCSNRWVFCVWPCGLSAPADFLVLLNPRVDFVHIDGPHNILSRNVIEQGAIVSRLLMESFINGMNTHINWQIMMAMRDNKFRKRRAANLEEYNDMFIDLNGLFIQDTAPDKVAPWTWACNQSELAKAVSASLDGEAIAHKRLIHVHPMLEKEEKKMNEVLSGLSRLVQWALAVEVLRLQNLMDDMVLENKNGEPRVARLLKIAYTCPECEQRSEVDYRRHIYPHLARLGYASESPSDSNGKGKHDEETSSPANGHGGKATDNSENVNGRNTEETDDSEKDQDERKNNAAGNNDEEIRDLAKNRDDEQSNSHDEDDNGESKPGGESNDDTGDSEHPDNNDNGIDNNYFDDDIFCNGRIPPLLFFNTFAAQNRVACRVAARLNLMLPTSEENHITDIEYLLPSQLVEIHGEFGTDQIIRYPIRRLVITSHDNYETMELLFGPHWHLSMKLRDILRRHRLMAMMTPPFGAPLFGRFDAWDEGSPIKSINPPTVEEYDQLTQIFRLQGHLRHAMDYERRQPREAEIQRVRNEHLGSVHRMIADMLMDLAVDGLDQNRNLFDVWR
ncbi:hypothetical protein VTN49DRAFT_528 [Thermomyces lanuginosus]|uniref:uncharacterized protein n=1 Tax=Thermomyces lanuginosus TaxID=5541 RepID=UPI003742A1CB